MAFKLEPNELFRRMAWFFTQNKHAVNPDNGRKALVKIACQGSSRSGKTYAIIQFIYTFCNQNAGKGLYIAVLRETLVDCRKYTYKDFIECFKTMGVYENCEITEYPNPKIKIYGNTIEFMGLPEPNKQPPRTDICFFNEIVEVNDKQRVNGLLMRCEKLAIFDWNPSYTDHWIFGMEQEFNTLFTRTSYLDNAHLTDNVVSNIESYCPWDFKDSKIEDMNGFKVRVWLKPERPDNCSPLDFDKYRADNRVNIESKTANKWYWLVYGEGVPAAKDGAIFDPEWVSEFPETGLDHVNLSLDFGYTCFEGDTEVTTLGGTTLIKNINKGEYVLTSEGYRRVARVNKNGIKKVIEKNISFDFGYRNIISTFDHKFKTDKGWKQFKDLQEGDKLVLCVDSKESNITAIPTASTGSTSLVERIRRGCTERFGKAITGRYLTVNISTISTVIRSTTIYLTSPWSQTPNITESTNILKGTSAKTDSRKVIGRKDGKRLMQICRLALENAHGVRKNTPRLIRTKGFALKNVITLGNTKVLSALKRIYVKIAEVVFRGTSILNRKRAQESALWNYHIITSVKTLNEYEVEVFDLTVEDVHEYFANGMLVHNCDPSVLVRSGVNIGAKELFAEAMTYSSTPDVDTLFELISPCIRKEIHRRKVEAGWRWSKDGIEYPGLEIAPIVIACDSADRYKDLQFVRDLNTISMQRGLEWQFVKVKKPSITVRISLLHRFRMFVVKSEHTTKEAQNYVYAIIEGRKTNLPIDNFNHFWDALGYGAWYFYRWVINL